LEPLRLENTHPFLHMSDSSGSDSSSEMPDNRKRARQTPSLSIL
jgi:hypothetical protein